MEEQTDKKQIQQFLPIKRTKFIPPEKNLSFFFQRFNVVTVAHFAAPF